MHPRGMKMGVEVVGVSGLVVRVIFYVSVKMCSRQQIKWLLGQPGGSSRMNTDLMSWKRVFTLLCLKYLVFTSRV